jgi:hypothetical protein
MLREDMVWTEGIETFFKDEAPKAVWVACGRGPSTWRTSRPTSGRRRSRRRNHDLHLVFGGWPTRPGRQSSPSPCRHNGILNDYGYWERGKGAWGHGHDLDVGSLEKQPAEWRDSSRSGSRPTRTIRTPMWLGECTWRAIKSYQKRGTGQQHRDPAVIAELEDVLPDAPVAGGSEERQGDWPHAWCTPVDQSSRLRRSSAWPGTVGVRRSPMTQWQPPEWRRRTPSCCRAAGGLRSPGHGLPGKLAGGGIRSAVLPRFPNA